MRFEESNALNKIEFKDLDLPEDMIQAEVRKLPAGSLGVENPNFIK